MKRGDRFGRPPKLTPDQQQLIRRLLVDGSGVRELAHTFKVHPATICRLQERTQVL
jgi:DNA invertase Pin-like site-specific DNA recombinase